MAWGRCTDQQLKELKAIVGAENLSTGESALGLASRDESYYVPNTPPQVVVMPSSAQEISAIMKIASPGRIPVTARGAGTSIEGNPVPMFGGIVVDMQRIDKIVQIRPEDFLAGVEARMGYKDLHKALGQHGLFFPPDPGASLELMREIKAPLDPEGFSTPARSCHSQQAFHSAVPCAYVEHKSHHHVDNRRSYEMKLDRVSQAMERAGVPGRDAYDLPSSDKRFPDGGSYRIEISGVEGPRVLEALIDERRRRNVPVHRLISLVQGGILFDETELRAFAQMAAEERMEVVAVPGPRNGWDIGRQYASSEGMRSGMHHRGSDELRKVIADMMRMYDAGIRGFMLVDEGLLWLVKRMQDQGSFPTDVALKISVWTSHSSAAGGRLLEELGASSFNPPGDLTLPQLASIRQAASIPLDFYIYTSISFGGFNRFYDASEVARVCSPCYFKFEPGPALSAGGGQSLYQPWVSDEEHIHLVRKKAKWAGIVRDLIEENEPEIKISEQGPDDLCVPKT